MSLTNDQITAKNFKTFYEGIKPYLGGGSGSGTGSGGGAQVQSDWEEDDPTSDAYIQNKPTLGMNYSTDEQVVGTWIDGRPIYQKTFDGLSIAFTKSDWVNTGLSIQNIDLPVSCMTLREEDVEHNRYNIMANVKVNGNGVIYIYQYYMNGYSCSSLTIQYTKTTDIVSS